MEIVKKLSLNKTPKDVPNGSIVCAKNMMIDDTGSFLTNDIGFKEAVSFEGEHIVGVIPCSSEIVILTIDDNNESHIYRKSDFSDKIDEVLNTWTYHGGKITGTYTYNYKNELILVIAESGATEDVPLKSFIIHDNNDIDSERYPYVTEVDQTYSVEENIPHYSSSYQINYNGNLVCGVYTFFIRFKIDEYNSTKWFQISSDIIINHEVLSKKYVHWYLNDSDQPADPEEGPTFNVNSDKISNKAIVLDVELGPTVFKEFEIGYIIKRKADVQGRLHGSYAISDSNVVTISSNNYIEEIGIDEFLENPHQFFNVENAINYNNRLYLTNYKEYDVVDYSSYASRINVTAEVGRVTVSSEANTTPGFRKVDLDIVIKQTMHKGSAEKNVFTKTDTVHIYNLLVNSDPDSPEFGKVVTKESIINPFISVIFLYALDLGLCFYLDGRYRDLTGTNSFNNSHVNLYWFIQHNSDFNNAICLYDYIGDNEHDPATAGWTWNFTIPSYDVYLTNGNLYIKTQGTTYQLTGESEFNSCILGYRNDTLHDYFYFGDGYGNTFITPLIAAGNRLPAIISGSVHDIDDVDPYDGGGDDGEQQGGIDVETEGVNTRTLMPKQKYNFFIHYIRKDGSCTPGYRIKAATFDVTTSGQLLVPVFDNILKPSPEFEGFFISYEDVERNCDCVYITYNDDGIQRITNAAYLYDIDTPRASAIYVNGTRYILASDLITYVENRLLYNHIKITNGEFNAEKVIAFITEQIENQYKNKYKTLYRLTRNIYEWSDDDDGVNVLQISDNDYLPDFYNKQIFITYNDGNGYIINAGVSYVFKMDSPTSSDNGNKTTYDLDIQVKKLYSRYPTEAMNVKEDFTEIATVMEYDKTVGQSTEKQSDLHVNSIVGPDKLHDYLELQPAYQAKPSKSYTNYRKDNISRFDKTVYRSDVISDEGLVHGFRDFDPNNYKNILENKGKITNIVGIGFYFIVHTEYSMFVFDRSPKLTKTRQLEIPDTFDIDYQEVMPSNEGFGGLRYKEESILTKNGYIWYDRANNIIFKYENGESQILSVDINNFIKYLDIRSVRFAEDIIHNRIFICLKVNISETEEEDLRWITLSYSFYTNTFISLHDFKFTNNYRTYNKSYIFNNSDVTNNVLYEFDENALSDYKALAIITEESWIFPTLLIDGNRYKSYVDIIFNETYEVVKVLNSIHYVLNQIESRFNNIIVSEETLERRFSGDEMRIYTDETNTFDFNINVDKDKLNAVDLYDLPAFEKGKWNLNYFRDVVNNVGFEINESESDNRRLIYGKYIVVRFIFHNDRKVKLDNIDVDIQLY